MILKNELYNNENSYNSIDILNFLRVVATMFVFFLHGKSNVSGLNESSNPFIFMTSLPAWAGVWIFIILSGYLMGKGFIQHRYHFIHTQRSPLIELLNFYYKRFLKLAPLYYFYCLLFELFTGEKFFWNNPKILRNRLRNRTL